MSNHLGAKATALPAVVVPIPQIEVSEVENAFMIRKEAWQKVGHPKDFEAMDRALDQLYALVPIRNEGKGKHIAIVVEKMEDGNGDLLFGIQMAHLLHSELPQATITFYTHDEHIELTKKLCGQEFAAVQKLIKPIPKKRVKDTFDLILEGPGITTTYWDHLTTDRSKVILLKEYGTGPLGVPEHFSHSMGLSDEEWGVIIDRDVPREISPEMREEALSKLQNKQLQQTLLQGKSAAQYLNQTNLFFLDTVTLLLSILSTLLSIWPTKNRSIFV